MENQPKMVATVVLDQNNVVTVLLPMAITSNRTKTETTRATMPTNKVVNVVVDPVAHLTDPLPSWARGLSRRVNSKEVKLNAFLQPSQVVSSSHPKTAK